MTLPADIQQALDAAVAALTSRLGENLHSLVLYGSAAREGVLKPADLNLLIVLEESTPEAHAAIAQAIRGPVPVEPFVLARKLLGRSLQAFAVKFLSIRRHRKVLHGADPLADLPVSEDLARFLVEQAVRNLRLRLVHAFIVFGHDRPRYATYVIETLPAILTDLAEALRQQGTEVPDPFPARIPLFSSTFGADASILLDLLAIKAAPRALSADEVSPTHARLFRLLDAAVRWMEATWPPLR
jgi:hypothetical protein